MNLVSTFVDLVQQVSSVMTQPTFQSFLIVLTGWVYGRRRTVTGMILAADAVGTKHHSAFHRVFASAQWSLDELGLVDRGHVPRRQGTVGLRGAAGLDEARRGAHRADRHAPVQPHGVVVCVRRPSSLPCAEPPLVPRQVAPILRRHGGDAATGKYSGTGFVAATRRPG